jgi:hypothetical protein
MRQYHRDEDCTRKRRFVPNLVGGLQLGIQVEGHKRPLFWRPAQSPHLALSLSPVRNIASLKGLENASYAKKINGFKLYHYRELRLLDHL